MIAGLKIFRVSGIITLWSNAAVVLTAMIVWETAHGWTSLHGLWALTDRIPAIAVISALCYGCGMLWNDLADFERDKRLAPNRPLPSGAISLRAAGITALVLPTIALIIAAMAGPQVLVLTALLLLLIAAYDFAGNTIPVVGPFFMASIRGFHAILWMTVANPNTPMRLASAVRGYNWSEPLLAYCLMLFLTIATITWLSELESRRGKRLELVLVAITWLIIVGLAAGQAFTAQWFVHTVTTGGYILATAWVAAVVGAVLFALYWPGKAWLKVLRSARQRHIGPVVGAGLTALIALDGLWASSWHALAGIAIWSLIPVFLLASKFMRMT